MARSYIVVVPGRDPQTVGNARMAAELVVFENHRRDGDDLVSQFEAMKAGDSAYLASNIQVHVVGHGEEEG